MIESLRLFVNEVEQVLNGPRDFSANLLPTFEVPQDVWLVLNPSALRDELCAQLVAFGYPVKIFSTFAECIEALRSQTPALLFSEAVLADQLLFDQKELIDIMSEHKRWLMVYSATDSFDLRINAVRHKTAGAVLAARPDGDDLGGQPAGALSGAGADVAVALCRDRPAS